jgi:predicted RNA-binding Zn-ribbon protein involved in translation (DUF1610 family)
MQNKESINLKAKTTHADRPERINCPACGNYRSLVLRLSDRIYECGCGYAYHLK